MGALVWKECGTKGTAEGQEGGTRPTLYLNRMLVIVEIVVVTNLHA